MPIPVATITSTSTTTTATVPSAPTLPAAAAAARSLRVNGGGDPKNLSPTHAITPPSEAVVGQAGVLVSAEASSREGTGEVEGLVGAAGKLEAKTVEIMEGVVGLAAFCERVGAFKDLEVCNGGE